MRRFQIDGPALAPETAEDENLQQEDIEKMERVWNEDGKRRFEITAKGKRYTIR